MKAIVYSFFSAFFVDFLGAAFLGLSAFGLVTFLAALGFDSVFLAAGFLGLDSAVFLGFAVLAFLAGAVFFVDVFFAAVDFFLGASLFFTGACVAKGNNQNEFS